MKKSIALITVALFLALLAPLPQPAQAADADWTMIVFMAGDNNLEDQINTDMVEMAVASSGVDVVVLADLEGAANTNLYHIKNGARTLLTTPSSIGTEMNTGLTSPYKATITYAVTNYPSSRYAIVFWDHGLGWGGVCFDMTSEDYLTNAEVREILGHAQTQAGGYIDVVGFDACYMNMLDMIYDCKDYADVFIASEMTEPWDGWNYDFLQSVSAATTKEQFGSYVCTYYDMYYGAGYSITQTALNLTVFDTNVTENFNQLMQVLKHRASSERSNIMSALDSAATFLNQQSFAFHDLYDFAHYMASYSSNATVDLHANRLKANITNCVIQHNGTTGNGLAFYFAEGAAEFHYPYTLSYLCKQTQADECQIQMIKGSNLASNVPDRVRINATPTATSLAGIGVQYKVGRGPWLSSPYNAAISGTMYVRTYNGADYSEQNVTTVSTDKITITDSFQRSTRTFQPGLNLFAPHLLGQDNLTAGAFCTQLGLSNTKIHAKQDDGSYKTYIQGRGPEDFGLVRGEAYYVSVEEAASYTFEGTTLSNQSIPLNPGLNLVGYYANKQITASELNVTGVQRIMKRTYNSTYMTYFPERAWGTDFLITPGDGVYIYAKNDGGIEI